MAMQTQAVQQCIQQCQQSASQLRSLAQKETNAQAKKMLNEGAHHLDMCITECQYVTSQANVQSFAMA